MAEIYRPEIPTGVLYAPIEVTSSGTLVVGVAGKRIIVVSAWHVAQTAVNVKFQTSSGPVDLTGPAYDTGNGGVVLPYNPGGWFATLPGDSLLINLSASTGVGGSISYVLA